MLTRKLIEAARKNPQRQVDFIGRVMASQNSHAC